MIAAVIPAFKASGTIATVLSGIGPEVELVVVVDDCCPENTGAAVAADKRVKVLRNDTNQGVGGAFLAGLRYAIDQGANIVVKIDADNQMDPALIPSLIAMIEDGRADYVKGNRFYFLSNAAGMPKARLAGNLTLSFLTKLSSGYWNIMDPTNGFIAIHSDVAKQLRFERVAKRFFFESDMLFHLGLIGARVADFPMQAVYADETSNLKVSRVVAPFLTGHLKNFCRRIVYKYFIRDFSVASIELLAGLALFAFGLLFGGYRWISAFGTGLETPLGTIMLASVSLLIGFQLLLAFLNYDITSVPKDAIHPLLKRRSASGDDLS